ncbi:MAG: hypothetical protein Q8N56_01855 [bacterium]|nr:hypothetical protein [bacterium]
MENLKLGDVCVITEIGDCDGWHISKDLFIGKRVEFIVYIVSPVNSYGYVSCCVIFIDPVPYFAIWAGTATCFYCVKLEKLNLESQPTLKLRKDKARLRQGYGRAGGRKNE